MFVRKKARVDFLHHHDAWIVSDFPSELPVPNVHRENFDRAALQQTVSETTRRRPDVERSFALHVDPKKIESAGKFQRASTNKLRWFRDRDCGIGIDHLRRFGENAVPYPDFACHECSLGEFAAFIKSAFD